MCDDVPTSYHMYLNNSPVRLADYHPHFIEDKAETQKIKYFPSGFLLSEYQSCN